MATVRTNGVDTYYQERGEGSPVVFVHGMFMNADQWAPQVEALADDYRTITYDVRGHGRTGGSATEPYSTTLFASDLAALLDGLDVERAVVCGLSMGGAIAQTFAVTYPDRVAGLVLADSFAAGEPTLGDRLLMANVRLLARFDRLVGYRTLNRLQMRVGNLLTSGVAGDPDAIQRVIEAEPRIPHAELVKVADATAAFPDSELAYARVETPVQVLHGEHLPGPLRSMARRLPDRFPNAPVSTAVVPDAGHASNLDNPAAFTDVLRSFLADVWTDGGGTRSDGSGPSTP